MAERFNIKKGYGCTYGTSKILRNSNAKTEVQGIHCHTADDFFEIILFIRGNSSFMIEGATYPLEPNDIMFTLPEELHGVIHHSTGEYERHILRVNKDFFVINNLKELYERLKNKQFGEGNYIHHDTPDGKLIFEILGQIENISETNDSTKDVISILNILAGRISNISPQKIPHPLLRQIILYINAHSHEDISLSTISKEFFINTAYLAKIFKQYTNTTLNQYIIAERLERARQYHFYSKISHTDAALAAGFKDYSSYYRAYKNKYGVPPCAMDSGTPFI